MYFCMRFPSSPWQFAMRWCLFFSVLQRGSLLWEANHCLPFSGVGGQGSAISHPLLHLHQYKVIS